MRITTVSTGTVSIARESVSTSVTSWSPIATMAVFGRHACAGPRHPGQRRRHRLGVEQHRRRQRARHRDLGAVGGQQLAEADRLDVADDVEDHDAAAEPVAVRRARARGRSRTAARCPAPASDATSTRPSWSRGRRSRRSPRRARARARCRRSRRRRAARRRRGARTRRPASRRSRRARRGPAAAAARRILPPSASPRSSSVTSWPRAAATHAASSPAGPPPTTTTRFGARRRTQRARAELGFASDRRVRHAGDRQALGQVAVAALVAAGAAADRVVGGRRAPSLPTPGRRSAPARA